jgi:hypothetical protein
VASIDEPVAMSRWLVTIRLVLVVVGLLWPWLHELVLRCIQMIHRGIAFRVLPGAGRDPFAP